jgi:hypothetical protein
VCCGLAHRTVRCTRTVQGSISHSRENTGALRYNSLDCSVCHWTVRCVSGQRLSAHNGRLQKYLPCEQCRGRSQSREVRGHRTVRCHKRTKLQRTTSLRTLTVGCRGGAPDCPVCPSPATFPTATLVVGGCKYPQPPQLQASKFSEDHIQYKSSSIHFKTQYKKSNPIRVPNSFQTLSGL